jgi:hypothetical protein
LSSLWLDSLTKESGYPRWAKKEGANVGSGAGTAGECCSSLFAPRIEDAVILTPPW